MYLLLYGAKRNAGDYLIFERAKALLRNFKPASEFIEYPRWQILDPILDTVNRAKGVILCGGPGYRADFYPGIFPLASDLSAIDSPIIPFSLGASEPVTTDELVDFTSESQTAIQRIHERIAYSSVRDVITERIVQNTGVKNVLMTGDPAWYYLPKVMEDFTPPKDIKRIVISNPARSSLFPQAVQLLRFIKQRFPKAERYLVFHRGLLPGKHAPLRSVPFDLSLAAMGYVNGYKVVDASYSTDNIAFYQDCDLHIGYRVHGHLYFLSHRKPSILLQEDIRGKGQSRTMGTPDIPADNKDALQELEETLEHYLDTKFEPIANAISVMKKQFVVMKEFLHSF